MLFNLDKSKTGTLDPITAIFIKFSCTVADKSIKCIVLQVKTEMFVIILNSTCGSKRGAQDPLGKI